MTLPRLEAEPRCVKCGATDPRYEFFVRMSSEPEIPSEERMCLQCRRCNFVWHRAPLDTPDPALDLSALVK